MLRYQRILFPVDFSLRCRQMAPMVESVAHQFFSEVVLLHVLDPLPVVCYAPEFNYFAPAEFIEKQRETMARELSEFAEAEFKDVSVTRLLATGDAADCITAQTSRSHIDLIMMPTHGRGVFRRLLLGSVTAKVLNDCSVPVWTMAHCDRFPVPAGHAIRRILCTLDTCVENIRVLQAAADLAGEYEAGVHLVHAIPGQEAYYENTIDPGLRQYVVRTAREKINELQHEAGTSWDLCVKLGPISDAVRKVAADYGADLVIMGRGRGSIGRGRMEDRFESKRDHATAIIRESPCPVLSV